MSGWISSKLKVAETLLQQIDQQAAESLRKNEASRSEDEEDDDDFTQKPKPKPKPKLKPNSKPPGDILKKKKTTPPEKTSNLKLNPKSTSTSTSTSTSLTDTDWTELLSAPPTNPNPNPNPIPKRQLRSGSNLFALDRTPRRSTDVVLGDDKLNSTQTTTPAVAVAEPNKPLPAPINNNNNNNNNSVPVNDEIQSPSPPVQLNTISDSTPNKMEPLSPSDADLDSDSTSDSESESETETEREERRKRREQLLAQKAAAKAIEAIKDRENLLARLEGEKQSLEKTIHDRAKQQAHEASELQMTMMETMEAVDLEKQKHNNTRMKALMKLAKLETTNAELAKSLAAAQWSLEVEVKRVAEFNRQIKLKEASLEELALKKRSDRSGNMLTASRGVEFEHEILEAEHTFVTDKVGQLQEKAKTLETSIQVTRKEIENPTEVEVELKRRLGQLTDHLIQKQAQVEALSSEKAMLMFRIEAVSRSLDESKLSLKTSKMSDLESGGNGIWEVVSNSKFQDRLEKGQKHIGLLVRLLDSIFLTGATFLRRNPMGRIWSFVYLVCLHLWVLYIFKSHTAVPYEAEAGSGAVISLVNINNTGV